MSRAEQRYEAITFQLLRGPATVRQLARALRRPQLLVWIDLERLEADGVVRTEWVQRPGWPDSATVAAYRLLTPDEAAERDAMERRVREALRALAEHVAPETTTPGGTQ
jgi:predicted ArsR family transcriptional regulator